MKFKISLFFILLCQFGFAQINENSTNHEPFIEVSGSAKMEIVPDQIYVSIFLEDDLKNDRLVLQQEKDLKKALVDLGLDLKLLSLTNSNADYVRVGFLKKDVLKKSSYSLLLSDASQLGKVFEKLDELKVQRAFISKLDHSNILEFQKELRIKAIVSAKEKADYLLNAIGEQSGKPFFISETFNSTNFNNYRFANNGYKANSSLNNVDQSPLNFKKISIQSSIQVKFKIQ